MKVRVERAIRSCQASGQSLALALVDCDRFKAVNDSRGHAFGDSALQCLARTLEGLGDGQGVVGRMGGDEFAVLIVGETEASARRQLEQASQSFKLEWTCTVRNNSLVRNRVRQLGFDDLPAVAGSSGHTNVREQALCLCTCSSAESASGLERPIFAQLTIGEDGRYQPATSPGRSGSTKFWFRHWLRWRMRIGTIAANGSAMKAPIMPRRVAPINMESRTVRGESARALP